MPHSTYPADSDLSALLASTGLSVPASLNLQEKCDSAVAEWETRTGWLPYLASTYTQADVAAAANLAAAAAPPPGAPVIALGAPVTATRLFDPARPAGRGGDSRSGRSLFLGAGLLSLVSLAVGVVPDSTGTYTPAASGTLLVNNLNFYLRPQNAAARNLPVTEIEFLAPPRGVPQSIAVTGVWGRTLLLEDNVWQAIVQRAAWDCMPELGISLTNGIVKIEDVQYLTSSGGSPLLNAAGQWGPAFDKLVKLKKRIVV